MACTLSCLPTSQILRSSLLFLIAFHMFSSICTLSHSCNCFFISNSKGGDHCELVHICLFVESEEGCPVKPLRINDVDAFFFRVLLSIEYFHWVVPHRSFDFPQYHSIYLLYCSQRNSTVSLNYYCMSSSINYQESI